VQSPSILVKVNCKSSGPLQSHVCISEGMPGAQTKPELFNFRNAALRKSQVKATIHFFSISLVFSIILLLKAGSHLPSQSRTKVSRTIHRAWLQTFTSFQFSSHSHRNRRFHKI